MSGTGGVRKDLVRYTGPGGAMTIPTSINGLTVSDIGPSEPGKPGGEGGPASCLHQRGGARHQGGVGGSAVETFPGIARLHIGAVPGRLIGS